MQQRVITLILSIGLGFALMLLVSGMSASRLPGNQQGYSPEQPIAFSHRLHAGELQIDCQFCHAAAAVSRYAGVPSSDTCMKCHGLITAPFNALQHERKMADEEHREPRLIVSPKLRKLYDSVGLGDDLKRKPGATPATIPWVRVHRLPDYVYFSHQAHVGAGVACQRCHGPVESMERMRQQESLAMGWCVNCHRDATVHGIDGRSVRASTDCATCHH